MKYLIRVLAFFLMSGVYLYALEPGLPSWNDTANKKAIISFIEATTNPTSDSFVPPSDRIATIDNDGTLWTEKPIYTQLVFVLKRIHGLAPSHPEWKTKQPFKAILENNWKYLSQIKTPEITEIAIATHAGLTPDQFQKQISLFLQKARHPRFKRPYTETVYQPMLELISYLQSKGYKVFIVTGGGTEFVRNFSEEVYHIPKEHVIGSTFQTEFKNTPDAELMIIPELVKPANNGPGKPVNIDRYIGRRPVIAIGNSDGDIEMLEYARKQGRPSLSVLVHHDDPEREYQYDRKAKKALQLARQNNWIVVSMKQDFKTMFPKISQQPSEQQLIEEEIYR